MESTETTQAPLAEDRQERQLIAGRYRLASLHRRDERTEVWRALDESAQRLVTLEFLRDGQPPSRERFLAEARRMATIQQPSVMRVAAIHDDVDGTFIVFEHLLHVPVELDTLKPSVEGPPSILKAAESATVEAEKLELVVAMPPAPVLTATSEPEAPTSALTNDSPQDHGLTALIGALRAREPALIDSAVLKESALEIIAAVRSSLEDLHLEDIRLDSVVAEARAHLDRVDMSLLWSALARAGVAARHLMSARPRAGVSLPHVPRPPRVRTARVKRVVPAMPTAPRAPSRLVGRVRWGRVVTRGLSLGLLAATVIVLPSEVVANIGNEVSNELSSALSQRSAAPSPSAPPLAHAGFELPPLGAYGAAFESEAPYPKARPSGTVDWVVALRNTGSVGWYRGIDGAQASLALTDGTSAGVQSTTFVGPGQVGWFVVHFRAPAQPGAYTVRLLPRIDGRGPLPDLGIYATVTVSTNP